MWIFIVILGHLLNAGAFLVDKFLLVRAVPKAVVYMFYIAMLGLVALVLLPFGYVRPTPEQFWMAAFAGMTFDLALVFFFSALRWLETSRVVPFVGGIQPLLILLFAFVFLGERLSGVEMSAIAALVFGTALISFDAHDATPAEKIKRARGWLYAFGATIFFAVSYTATKAVFDSQPFISGFVWIRVGSFLFALLFLARPVWRDAIFAKQDRPSGKYGTLFLSGQVAGAMGALLLSYAISLASVTVVTAMQGVQYVFLFVLAIFLGRRYTQLRERLSTAIVIRKLSAIVFIGTGLVLLTM